MKTVLVTGGSGFLGICQNFACPGPGLKHILLVLRFHRRKLFFKLTAVCDFLRRLIFQPSDLLIGFCLFAFKTMYFLVEGGYFGDVIKILTIKNKYSIMYINKKNGVDIHGNNKSDLSEL